MIGNIQAKLDAIWRAILELRARVSVIATNSGGGAGSGAPDSADYLVKTSNASLSVERVVTDNTEITWDWSTAGVVKAVLGAFTGDVTRSVGSLALTIANLAVTTAKIAANAVTFAKFVQASATQKIVARKTSGSGDYEECSLSDVLDFIGSAAQGDILYRGSSGWARLAAGTSGTFLKTNGAGDDPAWAAVSGVAGTINAVVKSAQQDVSNSAALVDDTHLQMTLTANKNYWFELLVLVTANSSAADIKVTIDGTGGSTPSGAVAYWGLETLSNAVAAWIAPLTTGLPVSLNDFGSTVGIGTSSTTVTRQGFRIAGLIVMGGSGGTICLRWAQNTATGSTTTSVLANSLLRYQQLN